MFYRYEIKNNGKEDILYLYLNMAYEFSRELVLDVNHEEITRRTKNFIKNNNINYTGDKVYLVIDGIVVKTLDVSSNQDTNEVITDLSYSNDKFLVTLKLGDDKFIEVTMREFLLGSLSTNMSIDLEEETLKSLAILYRTYAYKQMEDKRYIDINDGICMYRPISYYKMIWIDNFNLIKSKLNEAIDYTDCMFVVYRDKYILPFMHLCNNGFTYNHDDYPYLKSAKSLWDIGSPYYMDIKDFNYEQFNSILKCNITNADVIEILESDYNGFIKKLKIKDKIYTGEEFKKLLGLNSLNISIIMNKHYIRIISRGFGNCLGLSIYGANELAKNDLNYISILFYYFSNIKINKYV